jgi:hypothetical protein
MFAASKTDGASGGYQISRSLRFNTADTAYLVRAPATTTNRRTFTWSAWVKRSEITPYQNTFSANDNVFGLTFNGEHQFQVSFDVGVYSVISAQNFRDPSAWYHFVVAVDTTQATAANRVKMYVNGTQITAFSTTPTYPPQNFDTSVNQASSNHRIGAGPTYAGNWFGGYQADVYLIDGQQLTPSSFGATDVQTGVWGPTAFTGGAFGTNGFYVNFSDNSNNTAATLGADYSGNGNNFTPTNLSVTAGTGNDSFVDTPTLYGTDTGAGGTVRGNYATINPLQLIANVTVSNGNLYLQSNNNGDQFASAPSTVAARTGKWYAEFTASAVAGTPNYVFGVVRASWSPIILDGGGYYGRFYYTSEGYAYLSVNGGFYTNNSFGSTGATYASGDIIGVAMDLDAGSISFYKNGTLQGTPFTSIPLGFDYVFAGGAFTFSYPTPTNIAAFFANFGQRPFAYTAPSGFKALCTQNLPTPSIGATTATQANQYFTPVIYTGDGTNNRTISAGMTPDWTWIKERGRAGSHFEFDTLRGTGVYLSPNGSGGDNYAGSLGWTNSGPTTGGFKVDVGTNDGINYNTGTFVAWNWKANGAGVTNTAGSITSTVSANTTSGFSIVTYSGNSTNATVGHGLGVAPNMIFYKPRNQTEDWLVYHVSIGASNILRLNTTAASGGASAWQSTTPTSSVVYLGAGSTAQTGYNNILYCFAPVAGYSAFGSYTGNGSTNGPFVFTGMRPAYVLIKRTDTTDQWTIFDNTRSPSNVAGKILYANLTNAEDTSTDGIDMLSNGFKIRATFSNINASGGAYIYACFASNPLKYSLAR